VMVAFLLLTKVFLVDECSLYIHEYEIDAVYSIL
jgi:hypothetical protein